MSFNAGAQFRCNRPKIGQRTGGPTNTRRTQRYGRTLNDWTTDPMTRNNKISLNNQWKRNDNFIMWTNYEAGSQVQCVLMKKVWSSRSWTQDLFISQLCQPTDQHRGALYRSSNFNFKDCYGDQCYAGVVYDRVFYNKASDLLKHE